MTNLVNLLIRYDKDFTNIPENNRCHRHRITVDTVWEMADYNIGYIYYTDNDMPELNLSDESLRKMKIAMDSANISKAFRDMLIEVAILHTHANNTDTFDAKRKILE